MALNIPAQAPAAPSFGGGAPQGDPSMAPAQAPQGAAPQQAAAAEEAQMHKTVKSIDDRLNSASREAQQFVTKAVAAIPALPTLMGILIGPEAQDYFTQIQQMIAQSQQGQQNSPAATPAMAPADQNPQAAPQAAGGSPAMATSTPPMA